MTYFPLDRDFLTSSMFVQGTPEQIKVFVYLLLAANPRNGVVEDAVPAIALRCGLSLDVTQAALEWLSSPDPYSRTKDHEGRRIERLPDGGFLLLNYLRRRDKDYSTPRVRRWRERNAKRVPTVPETGGNDEHEHGHEHNEQTDMSASADVRAQVLDVHEFWRASLRPDAKALKVGSKRYAHVKARLAEGFTVDQLKRAIDGCAGSDFHVAGNHTDLELICRSAEKVERFASMAPSRPVVVSPEELARERTQRALAKAGGA